MYFSSSKNSKFWAQPTEISAKTAHEIQYNRWSLLSAIRITSASIGNCYLFSFIFDFRKSSIKAEHPEATDLDIGFRVLKVADSNMRDVYYKPNELKQADLLNSIDNIKSDRTPLDLLFGVMVEWGVPLSLSLKEIKVGNNTIHIVGDSDLVACFDKDIDTETITKMAELNPVRVIFRDFCFTKDDEKINMFEIFKTICHWADKQAKNNVRVM